jgi:hypothetical protein
LEFLLKKNNINTAAPATGDMAARDGVQSPTENGIAILAKIKAPVGDKLASVIEALKPMGTPISKCQKKHRSGVGNKTLVHLQMMKRFINQSSSLMPRYIADDSFCEGIDSLEAIKNMRFMTKQIDEFLKNIEFSFAEDIRSKASLYYKSVKAACTSGIPGADTYFEELRKFYIRPSSAKNNQNDSPDGEGILWQEPEPEVISESV